MISKTFKIIGKVILWLLVAILVYVAVKLLVGQITGKAVFFGDSSYVRITTKSMINKLEPEKGINVGDYIVIKKVDIKDLKKDDIISFYSNDDTIKGKLNTHRIYDIKQVNGVYEITTKGDNNSSVDTAKVYEENIVGRFTKKLVFITSVMNIITQNAIVFILVVGVIIIITMMSILKGTKELKKQEEQQKIQEEIEKIKKDGIEKYTEKLNKKEDAKNVSKAKNKEED